MNLTPLVAAMSRIRAARFAGDRRASVRFDVRLEGKLAKRRCVALDVSLTGAQVVVPGGETIPPDPGLELRIESKTLRLACDVRRVTAQPDGTLMVGLAFASSQPAVVRRLALSPFGADQATWRTSRRAPARQLPRTRPSVATNPA